MSEFWLRHLPTPDLVTSEVLPKLNEMSLRQISVLVAGHPIVELRREPPDAEDRGRAASVAQKILDLWHAEIMDEARAVLGSDMKHIPREHSHLGPFVETQREAARVLLKNIHTPREIADDLAPSESDDPDAQRIREKLKASAESGLVGLARLSDGVTQASNMLREFIFLYDIVKAFREDPTWIPDPEEFMALYAATGLELWEQPPAPDEGSA